MPKLKPLATLEETAFDALLGCVVRCCDQLSAEKSLDELHTAISDVKKHLCMHMPSRFLAEFSRRFLDEFCAAERPACYRRAALEIIMDLEIVEFKCDGTILAFMDPHDGYRFQGLAELDLDCFPDTATINLKYLQLNDLTTFIYPRNCTDRDLTVIGQNSPNLEIVKIPDSNNVTDDGLRALSPCSEFRVIDIVGCAGVTHLGINHLLSVHGKLNDLAYAEKITECEAECHHRCGDVMNYVFSHLDSSVQCTSMNRFYVDSTAFSDEDLSRIVTKFPNLTYLGFTDFPTESLFVLTSLNQLTELEFNYAEMLISRCWSHDASITWMSMKEILPSIGVNISSFKFSCRYQDLHFNANDLNFTMNSCPNIECLKFDHGSRRLIVPPFKKLKELTVCCSFDSQNSALFRFHSVIQFDELLKLETLTFVNFQISAKAVKSLMLDDVRLPNLSVIETNGLTNDELAHLEGIAKIKNLDFQIENHLTIFTDRSIMLLDGIEYRRGDLCDTHFTTLDIQVTDQ